MTLFEILNTGLNIPCAYSHFKGDDVPAEPPYLVYIGNGQRRFEADNSYYWTKNRYQVEYYFSQKDEEQEEAIEQLLLGNGFLYDKSEDVYIEEQGVFVIYYYI